MILPPPFLMICILTMCLHCCLLIISVIYQRIFINFDIYKSLQSPSLYNSLRVKYLQALDSR